MGAITTPLAAPCSDDDFNSLNSKKDAAKSTADDAVAKQTNLKAAATDDYNAANEEIISLNAQIAEAGGSTIAAGTAAPTVATVFVEQTTDVTGSTFTDDTTFTGSTPTDGSIPTGSTFDGSSPTGSTFDGSSPTGSAFDGSSPSTGESTFTGSTPTGDSSITGSTGTGGFTG